MAEELQLRDSQDEVKIRSPWAAALLPIITLGIYHLVWWYKINRELRDYGRAKGVDLGQNPTNSVLALFPGGLIIVPALVSYWRGTQRVQKAAQISGQEPVIGWLALVLFLVISIGLWAYLQDGLNKVWRAVATPLTGAGAGEIPSSAGAPPAGDAAATGGTEPTGGTAPAGGTEPTGGTAPTGENESTSS
jgi:Domain of unknown function (DUF4234)